MQQNIRSYIVTTSKQYTGKEITLKNTDLKIVDKKSGVDLSSYIKNENAITIDPKKL